MDQLFSQAVALMSTVPSPLVYLIAALWVGVESAGIGVPIEPMMLFVGSLTAQGSLNLALAIAIVSLGCLACSSVAYIIGRRSGTAAVADVGRFVGLNRARADHLELWLRHRGAFGVFVARVTPMVRTFGSYIMGAADVPPATFVLGTLAGALLYCGAWIVLGNALGENYRAPLHYLDQFGTRGILIALGVVVVVLVVHHFWGRLTFHRMAIHFRRHHEKVAAQTAVS
jgi:membrane protein DedA with SNARE-associated domain